MNEKEIFKDSPVFPENYWITNKGRVITKKTKLSRKFRETWDGYYDVTLWNEGKSQTIRVHRLVARAFIKNPNNYPVTNHLDGDKTNNSASNLEWTTVGGNTRHSYSNGLQKSLKGTSHGRSKFTKEQIVKVCELLDEKQPHKDIERITGVSKRTIQVISSGVNWTHISKDYNFFKERHVGDYSKEQIIEVCELLEKGTSIPVVSKELNIPLRIIQNIDRGHIWTEISKDYNFYKIKQAT